MSSWIKTVFILNLIFFDSIRVPKFISSEINSVQWLGIYGGNDPIQTDNFIIKHHYNNVITTLGLEANAPSINGKIDVNGNVSFVKTIGGTHAWLYRGVQDVNTLPLFPRYFGDRKGDIITPRDFVIGKPSLIVCTDDGVNSSTLGTWRPAGIIT